MPGNEQLQISPPPNSNLIPGTLGPGGGGVNQAMQAATASRMRRMHTLGDVF